MSVSVYLNRIGVLTGILKKSNGAITSAVQGVDYYAPGGTDVAVVDGGTGTSTGSITGTGALTFAAGGSNQDVNLTPSGSGKCSLSGNAVVSGYLALAGASASATAVINLNTVTVTNVNGFTSINNVLTPVASSTGTYSNYCDYVIMYPSVASGVTNSGAMYAVYATSFRGATVATDDSGTLNTLTGCRLTVGHSANSIAASPITTSVFGFRLTPYILRGTITTYYGAYLDAPTVIATPATWATGAKTSGVLCQPTVATGYYYVCTTAGNSAASEPSPWSTTVGGTTTDGSVTWTTISIPSIGTEWGLYVASTTAKNYIASNLGVGQLTFGTSATKTLAISTGTAPSSSPADCCQIYSKDQAAGNACFHTRTENGKEIKLYQQAHLADPGESVPTLATWAASVNTYLENLGLIATA